ncbi:MAG: hypothetical protein GY847_35000 [Proteobacteria bacterium]|nr:hypothetical protein [Pseudomonadota bacterium]
MEAWPEITFTKCIVKHGANRNNQINSSEVKVTGMFPVVDQGQSFIAGYTDDKSKLIRDGFPYVIFGDHTRCFKYVDFPFVLGADGTKVLKPDPDAFFPRFFYYAMLSLDIPSRGYNRHFKLVKEKSIPKPSLAEQHRIAAVLSLVQRAIEEQERLIALTTELKKAMMHKLFTEGTRGEPQKQTKIGPIPKSWEVVQLKDTVKYIDYGLSKAIPKIPPPNGVNIVSTADITRDGELLYWKIRMTEAPEKTVSRLTLKDGDVLFNWRNSPELIGKTTIYDEQPELHIFASFILRLRCDEVKSHNYFIKHLMNHWRERGVFIKLSRRAVNQANYNKNEISALKIPQPDHDEQVEIAKTIRVVEDRIGSLVNRRNSLQALFRTLLHQLMTAEIRVNDLDFAEMEPLEQAVPETEKEANI